MSATQVKNSQKNRNSQLKTHHIKSTQPMSHRTSRQGAGRRNTKHQGGTKEIMAMVDEHLAWQLKESEHERPMSSGTMFVDWDGTSLPKISYRNETQPSALQGNTQRRDSVLSTTETAVKDDGHGRTQPHIITTDDGLQVTYHPSRPSTSQPAYVAGYDPSTSFAYDYNGHIMHVHRSATRRESQYSEYYAVDAAQYDPQVPLKLMDKETKLPPLPPVEQKKREKVGRFVQKVLWKFEGLGVMKTLRGDRKKEGGDMEECSWVKAGYVT